MPGYVGPKMTIMRELDNPPMADQTVLRLIGADADAWDEVRLKFDGQLLIDLRRLVAGNPPASAAA